LSTAVYENLYQEELYNIRTSLLVVLNREWNTITEDEKTLLSKILGSVRVSPASTQILARPTLSINSLKTLSPAKVIVFGSVLDEAVTPYQNHSVDGVSVIKADDLSQLDDVKKKNLWLALKQMFGV
jgi:hypothetical protein